MKKSRIILESLTSALSSNKLEAIPLYQKTMMIIESFKSLEKGIELITIKAKNEKQRDSVIILDSFNLQEDNFGKELTEELISVGRGYIIKLSVGHNGFLTELELKTLLYHLEKASFLN